jgi:uncharacterized protein (TIGR02145 family)
MSQGFLFCQSIDFAFEITIFNYITTTLILTVMKNLKLHSLFVFLMLLLSLSIFSQETGTFTDIRDDHIYKWVKIGDQLWMAENLAYLPSVSMPDSESYTEPVYYVYDYRGTSVIKAKTTTNYKTYGVLYNWPAAMNGAEGSSANPSGVQGICPSGWRIPSDVEWNTLENYFMENGYNYDGTTTGNKYGKAFASDTGWSSSSNEGAVGNTDYPAYRNKSGFTALPGGARNTQGEFVNIKADGAWVSTTESDSMNYWGRDVFFASVNVNRANAPKELGLSVRCLMYIIDAVPIADFTASQTSITSGQKVDFTDQSIDNPTSWSWSFGDGGTSTLQNPSHTYSTAGIYTVTLTASNSFGTDSVTKAGFITVSPSNDDAIIFNPNLTYGTMTGIDGNTYKTIQICNQSWMAENLKTTKFNDGTDIPLVTEETAWVNLTTPGYCWYDNDSAINANPYGALYNWYTINTGNLCPSGWHVPNDAEWTTLINCLGGDVIAGGKLKEIGFAHWYDPNSGATNESGFTALPGGHRDTDAKFRYIGYYGYWWSATENNATYAWYRTIYYDVGPFCGTCVISNDYYYKMLGLSVRCVKDNNPSITNSMISEEVIFYPNPATEKLYLKNNNYANSLIMIFDLQGKQVLSMQIDSNPIDISNLEKGVYVVKLVCSENVLITKFIKE